MNHSKEEYLRMMEVAPIWGFPTEDEKCYKVSIVKVRGAKSCVDASHPDLVPTGTIMLRETALFDNVWRSAYTCTSCLDNWMEQVKQYG